MHDEALKHQSFKHKNVFIFLRTTHTKAPRLGYTPHTLIGFVALVKQREPTHAQSADAGIWNTPLYGQRGIFFCDSAQNHAATKLAFFVGCDFPDFPLGDFFGFVEKDATRVGGKIGCPYNGWKRLKSACGGAPLYM